MYIYMCVYITKGIKKNLRTRVTQIYVLEDIVNIKKKYRS